MKRIRLNSAVPRDKLLETVRNFNLVNEGVLFDERRGKPAIKVTEKGDKICIKCEMVGGPSKDNGFLIGTYFSGKITEKNGVTTLRGRILTDPIYHLFMLGLIGFFLYRCIILGGFNVVPVCVAAFGFLLMKDEYKKQGIIARYLCRAFRKAEEKSPKDKI